MRNLTLILLALLLIGCQTTQQRYDQQYREWMKWVEENPDWWKNDPRFVKEKHNEPTK